MSVYQLANTLFSPIEKLLSSSKKATCISFEIALWVYKPGAMIQDHYETIYQLIPIHIKNIYGLYMPPDVTKIILDYLAAISTLEAYAHGPVQFDNYKHIKEANKLLQISDNNSMVQFRDDEMKHNSNNEYNNDHMTWVGGRDYIMVKSKYMVNFEQRVIINCFVKSLSDEMWIGFINKNEYNCFDTLKNNKHAISYNDCGVIYAFGNWYNISHEDACAADVKETQYWSGDWITFDVTLTHNDHKDECCMKIYKNGKFIIDCTNDLKLCDCMDQLVFCVEVDAPNDTVFVEQTLPWKQPMQQFDWVSYYISLKGNEFFCKVDHDFISDFCQDNVHWLEKEITNYQQAHQRIQLLA
eukprot:425468_1